MTRTKPLAAALAAAALLAAGMRPGTAEAQTAAEAASYVVLASTAPDFTVGAMIYAESLLEVPVGASLTLIDAAGAIKVIEGPFMGRLRGDAGEGEDEDAPSFLSDLANIVAVADTPDVAVGMGRSSIMAPEVSPWLVAFGDAMAEDICVSPDGQLVFLRASADDPLTVRFAMADGSTEVSVTWPANDPLLRWPEAMPAGDGNRYVIDPGMATKPPMMTMHMMPDTMPSDAHAAVWLARSGCHAQAEAMVRRLALGG